MTHLHFNDFWSCLQTLAVDQIDQINLLRTSTTTSRISIQSIQSIKLIQAHEISKYMKGLYQLATKGESSEESAATESLPKLEMRVISANNPSPQLSTLKKDVFFFSEFFWVVYLLVGRWSSGRETWPFFHISLRSRSWFGLGRLECRPLPLLLRPGSFLLHHQFTIHLFNKKHAPS